MISCQQEVLWLIMNNVPENLTKIQIMVICVQSKISMSYDSEDFVTRQQWGYFEFTPMFISMFNPNVHHNVHPNVHSNVHPNVHPNSQTSPFIIPVSSVSLPGWKSTFFSTKHRQCPRWMLVGEVWRDDKTQQLNVLLPQYSVALLAAGVNLWRI